MYIDISINNYVENIINNNIFVSIIFFVINKYRYERIGKFDYSHTTRD